MPHQGARTGLGCSGAGHRRPTGGRQDHRRREFIGVNGVTRPLVARLLPDGSVDPAFNNSKLFPTGSVNALALQPDGKILVDGLFYRTTDAAPLVVGP